MFLNDEPFLDAEQKSVHLNHMFLSYLCLPAVF